MNSSHNIGSLNNYDISITQKIQTNLAADNGHKLTCTRYIISVCACISDIALLLHQQHYIYVFCSHFGTFELYQELQKSHDHGLELMSGVSVIYYSTLLLLT